MHLLYLMWIVFVFGGAFMGVGAILAIGREGFAWSLLANAVVYLGFALYGVPKLFKLLFKRG
jgi:hypothetical protein